MNSLTVASAQQTRMQINIEALIKVLIKKWWVLLALTIAFSVIGMTLSEITSVDTFSSGITFIVSNRTKAIEQGAESISMSDIVASINMTNNFKYLLIGRTMCTKISESLVNNGYKITPEIVKNYISIKSIQDTSILEISVKTKNAELSKKIADALAMNYKDVISVYQGAEINIYAKPELAILPDPNTAITVYGAIGGLFGIALAVIIITLINYIKGTIQSAEDIRERLDIQIMGTVRQVAKKNKSRKKSKKNLLISERSSGFDFIETYKAIRTKIEGVAAKNGYKTFVVSSAVENEGKTTVATNIALALAQNGKTVLLIDADIRKPSVCKLLGISNVKEKGLPEVITGVCSADKAICYIEKFKLFLLAGTVSFRNPTELLSLPKTEKLIKTLESDFDFIIIDTPPVGVITDASIIANYADALILVIREDTAPVNIISLAISDLTENGTDLIGCVYNNVTSSKINIYGNYKYGKYHKSNPYGYGYSSAFDKEIKIASDTQTKK